MPFPDGGVGHAHAPLDPRPEVVAAGVWASGFPPATRCGSSPSSWTSWCPANGLSLETAPRGEASYDPRMMLAAWLYGYMTRIRQARRLEVAARENLPLIWLLGGEHPDHRTLSRFLAANQQVVAQLFKRTVRTAVEVGLVEFAFQAVDGTRVGAVSPDKMRDRAALEELEERVDAVLAQMAGAEGEEGEEAAAGPGVEMPAELRDPQALRARIGVALAQVAEREASRTSHHPGAVDPQTGEARGPQVSLADPEAVLLKGRQGYVAGYNAQAAVDAKARVIVAAEVIAQASDQEALGPMLEQIQANTGRLAEVTAADGGYHSAANLEALAEAPTALYVADPALKRQEAQGERAPCHQDAFVYDEATDTYRCPAGQTLSLEYANGSGRRGYRCHGCEGCPYRPRCPRDRQGRRLQVRPEDPRLRAHRAQMRTPEARAIMRRRGATVEPVFGILREHLGLARFLHRGLAKVRAEWQLWCAAFNRRVLWKAWWSKRQVVAAA